MTENTLSDVIKDFLEQRPHLIKVERIAFDNNGMANRCTDNARELQIRIGGVLCCGWLLFRVDERTIALVPHYAVLKEGIVLDSTPCDSWTDSEYYLDLYPPTSLPMMPVILVKEVGWNEWEAKRVVCNSENGVSTRSVGKTKRLDNEAIAPFSFL